MGSDPLTTGVALTRWHFSPVMDALVAFAALGYAFGVHRVARRGGSWPLWRTVVFGCALLVTVLAMDTVIDSYGMVLFSVHMIQHLLLIMVVPALLVWGAPWELADRAGAERFVGRARASRITRFLLLPATGILLYAAVLVLTHLTGFMQQMMVHPWLHGLEIGLYLVIGYLFLLPLLSSEPVRNPLAYPLRVFVLLLATVIDTGVGLALMLSDHILFPAYAAEHRMWGPTPLGDLHDAGAIMWVGGDCLMMLMTVVVAMIWISDTEHGDDTGAWLESARLRALSDIGVDVSPLADAADVDTDDAALAAYNRMLAALEEREHPRGLAEPQRSTPPG